MFRFRSPQNTLQVTTQPTWQDLLTKLETTEGFEVVTAQSLDINTRAARKQVARAILSAEQIATDNAMFTVGDNSEHVQAAEQAKADFHDFTSGVLAVDAMQRYLDISIPKR